MGRFIRNVILCLLPALLINVLFFGWLFYLSANDDLTYVNYASALDKEHRLSELPVGHRLVIIGGSNTRYGFDSSILEDSLELSPVNMGIHIGLGLDFMFSEIDTALTHGDVLIVSPEYDHFLIGGPYYGDEGLTDMYLIKGQWGEAVKHIADTHNFNSLYRLIRRRIKRRSLSYDDIPADMEIRTKYNIYGDYVGHYDCPSKSDWDKSPKGQVTLSDNVLSDMRSRVASLRECGVEVLFLPPPYSRTTYHNDSVIIDQVVHKLDSVGIPFLFDPGESVYDDSLFYDTRYHLTHAGAVIHSDRVAQYIKKYLTR